MAVSKNPLKAVDFSSVSIKAQPVKREKQQTYAQADWSGLGDKISGIGDSVAAGLSKSKTPTEEFDKQNTAAKGKDQTNLQDRISTAKSQGKEDKVARLEGKQERRDVRQKSRAEIITAKNVDKKAKTEANRANKESKFNEKQIEKGGMVTEGYVDNLQKKSQAKNKMDASMQAASDAMGDAVTKPKQTSHTFLTAEPKTPVLQKLGSTGKGFKLRAFRSN